jgi:hypothetical protein
MTKFEFKCIQQTGVSASRTTTVQTDAHVLPEVIEEFQTFLRGCGYYFNGVLEFVDENDGFSETKL